MKTCTLMLQEKIPSCHLFAGGGVGAGPFPDVDFVSDFHASWLQNGGAEAALPSNAASEESISDLAGLKELVLHRREKSSLLMFTASADSVSTPELVLEFAWELSKGRRKRVLIVDCDLRSPALTKAYGIEQDIGLSDFLTGRQSLRDIVKRTNLRNVCLVRNGLAALEPVVLFMSARFLDLIKDLQRRFDHILLNAPVYGAAVDTFALAKFLRPMVVIATGSEQALSDSVAKIHSELSVLRVPILNIAGAR